MEGAGRAAANVAAAAYNAREMIHGKNAEVRLTREGYKVSGGSLLSLPLFACEFGKPPEMGLGGTFWCFRPA